MKQFIASFRQSAFIHFFTISLLTFTFILSGSEIQAQTSTKISLPYFSGQIVNRVVNLSWQTNQEDGVSHFEIQRSINGTDFTPVASLTAIAKKSTAQTYYQRDDLFMVLQNYVHYRIRIIGEDGSEQFSRTLSIATQSTSAANLKLYPVPCRSVMNIQLNQQQAERGRILILNQQGVLVNSYNYSFRKGMNQISLQQVAALAPGQYILQVETESERQMIPFTKG